MLQNVLPMLRMRIYIWACSHHATEHTTPSCEWQLGSGGKEITPQLSCFVPSDSSPSPFCHFVTGLTSEYFLSKWMSVSCRKVMVLELPSRFTPLLVCSWWLLMALYCRVSASLWLLDGRYKLFSNFLFLSFSLIKDSKCLSMCCSKGEPLSSWWWDEVRLQRWSASQTSRGSKTFWVRTYWICG